MRDIEFWYSAGKSFGQKIKVMTKSEANIRTKDTLESAIEDRRKNHVPKEFIEAFDQGLKEGKNGR